MKLSRIGLKGVAGLPDLEAEFGASPPGLVFVEGGPASGKTRLIEAVLACLEVAGPYHGIVRAEDWVAPGGAFQRAEMQLDFALDEVEHEDARAFGPLGEEARVVVSFERGPAGHTVQRRVDRGLARLLERYAHDGRAGKREYFPETRQLAWGSRNDGTGALQQSLLRSTKDPQKYSFIARYLESASRDKPERERIAEAVARLVPWLRFVAAGDSFGFARKNAAPTSLARLSSFEAD
ncbi:MAG TPA: hypothetical protein VL400_19580, partial [Polyangiaceae bacterium]|nr:hypothetical protein [Polyangiaceae bacterium]